MTRTHAELGSLIDVPPAGPMYLRLFSSSAERVAVVEREEQAEPEGDSELARELAWERGIMDLYITRPGWDLESACPVGQADRYSECYGFTDETRAYALERANETENQVLRLHHLEFALRKMSPTGLEWVEMCRKTAAAYRDFADSLLTRLQEGEQDTRVISIDDAMTRLGALTQRRGILRDEEQQELAEWIVGIAQQLRDMDWPVEDYNRPHRWPFEIAKHLTAIGSENIGKGERETALRLVDEAYTFFSSQPLADTLATKVAEVEHELRRHFGEEETHYTLVRSQYDAIVQKAQFFATQGNHLGAQVMFRHARKLATQHGQYFESDERDMLEHREQEAIEAAVAGGSFKAFHFSVPIDPEQMNRSRKTAEATIDGLVSDAIDLIPDYKALMADAAQGQEVALLSSLFPAITMEKGKVVREVLTKEQHFAADVESRVCLHTRLIGGMMHVTLTKAAEAGGLQAEDVLAPLLELPSGETTRDILLRGIERYLADDYISAAHILIPSFEDALRNLLTAAGFHTVAFQLLDPETGASRTDDMTLGALLRAPHPGGGSVEDFLGADLWHYISATMASPSGLNLRNKFAHGLARANDCTPEPVGITIHLLFCLVVLARKLPRPEAPSQR